MLGDPDADLTTSDGTTEPSSDHHDDAEPEAATTRQRLRRPRSVVGALGALVLVAGLVAWPMMAAGARSQVQVILDVDPLTCHDTRVEHYSGQDEDRPAIPVAVITEDMDCRLQFFVRNDSGTEVTVERVLLPVLGPATGSQVTADALGDIRVTETESETDGPAVDAVFDFEGSLIVPAGYHGELSVHFVHNPAGCTSGGWFWFSDEPTVTVEAFGLSGERNHIGEGFGFHSTAVTPLGDGCGGN